MRRIAIAILATSWLVATPARATDVPEGLGLRLTQSGLDFAGGMLTGMSLELSDMPLGFQQSLLGCDYQIDIYGFSGFAELGAMTMELQPAGDAIGIHGTIDRFEITDAVLVATTPDWWCFNYNDDDQDVIIELLASSDATFDLYVTAESVGFEVELVILEGSAIDLGEVEIQMAPWYTPDSLVETAIGWFQQDVETMLLETITEQIQTMVQDLPLAGNLMGFDYGVLLDEIEVDAEGVDVVSTVSLTYAGEDPECGGGVVQGTFDGAVPVGLYGPLGDVQISATQPLLHAALAEAWAGGMLCGVLPEILDLTQLAGLLPALGEAPEPTIEFDVVQQLLLELHDGGMTVIVPELILQILSSPDAEGDPLLDLSLGLSATLELELDHDVSAVLATLGAIELDVDYIHSAGLVQDSIFTEEEFAALPDNLVVPLAMGMLQGMQLLPIQFSMDALAGLGDLLGDDDDDDDSAAGGGFEELLADVAGIRLERMTLQPEATALAITLLDEVDEIPPTVEILTDLSQPAKQFEWDIEFSGSDAEGGPLVYSWQVDEGSWTAFAVEASAPVVVTQEGSHTFAVKSRDNFWNESQPAMAVFTIPLPEEPTVLEEGCACRHNPADAGPRRWWLGLLLIVLLAARRIKAIHS